MLSYNSEKQAHKNFTIFAELCTAVQIIINQYLTLVTNMTMDGNCSSNIVGNNLI